MDFAPIAFDKSLARRELTSFKAWMSQRPHFSEAPVVAEIKCRPQMACLFGFMVLLKPDRIRFEFAIKGLFRADLVVGNASARNFVLVEFEGGQNTSIFSGGTKKYRYWSRQIEHGFGQVVDWAWVKHDHPHDTVFTDSFGGKVVEDTYMVVCGRTLPAGGIEERRFDFRRSRVQLSGVPVKFLTYDDMVAKMDDALDALQP